jgi:hypothetical protein
MKQIVSYQIQLKVWKDYLIHSPVLRLRQGYGACTLLADDII